MKTHHPPIELAVIDCYGSVGWTAKAWIVFLDEDEREDLIVTPPSIFKNRNDYVYNTLSQFLLFHFSWNESIQGFDYWNAVYDKHLK